MESLWITGGRRLAGDVTIGAAKNAVLPIMAASILSEEPTTLLDCPELLDVKHMADILLALGCDIRRQGRAMHIHPESMSSDTLPDDLAKRLRSSIFLLGPILSRFRRATVTYPGGCEIGMRPIDLHLYGLRQLGVRVREEGGLIHCDGGDMHSAAIHFDYPSVGATENAMMAAVTLSGRTTLHNAAREPEIADLQHFLNAMGARVSGAGSHTVTVDGVSRLRGATYRPMPDRIVAGTLLAAAAITGGQVHLRNVPVRDMLGVLHKLEEMGCEVSATASTVTLSARERLRSFGSMQTQPHPGFPTDMQMQMLALSTLAKGTSIVVENVFENRFTHAGDLNRMGANVVVNGRTAIVQGVERLYGACVTARDLRGGAALVLAGLAAEGETRVDHAEYIRRGYEHLEEMLSQIGADIRLNKFHNQEQQEAP